MPGLFFVLLLGTATASELPALRQSYVEAESLIDSRRFADYRALRSGLDNYPLAIYLDYLDLQARLIAVDGEQARDFLDNAAETPLANRFKGQYLRSAGRLRRWDHVLTVSPEPPKSVDLQCYFFRAHNMEGDRRLAWQGAESLWLHGKSRPKACDPLFSEWIQAGNMTDGLSWQRQLLAFDARRSGLMRYAADKGSRALRPWSDRLMSAYERPDRIQRLDLPVGDPKSRDVYVKALKRLARQDAGKALSIWLKEHRRYPFSRDQVLEALDGIASRAVSQDPSDTAPWLDEYLATRGDAGLLERRLRRAIAQSDWKALETLVAYLPEATYREPIWQFWEGYAARENGNPVRARAVWSGIAGEREYYGFLAAELTGQPYQLNHRPLPPPADPAELAALERLQSVQRTGELMYHQRGEWARSEWMQLLPQRPRGEQLRLAQYATLRGWHRFAIDATVEAEAWDALELRFPRAFEPTFVEMGQQYAIPETELMAIARRESSFFPEAVSGAGARGLMQLLPSTAQRFSSLKRNDLSQQLFDVKTNVALGSAYYRQLLDRYSNNRVLTLAAYNAGPQRVRRWRTDSGLSAPQWVETIPFRETRDYVKSVLAYNVVYRAMNNAPASLFNRNELEDRY
jgi:soluble lytic murein transglycosylase